MESKKEESIILWYGLRILETKMMCSPCVPACYQSRSRVWTFVVTMHCCYRAGPKKAFPYSTSTPSYRTDYMMRRRVYLCC